MKKRIFKNILSIILVVCLCLSFVPTNAIAETENIPITEMSDLEQIVAGMKTVEEVFGKLDESTVPEIVGYDRAVSSNHIERMYSDEGNDLNKIVFLNADGSKTAYVYDYPVKYVSDTGAINDITLEIEQSADLGYKSAANSTVTTFSANVKNGIELSGNDTRITLIPHIPQGNSKTTLSKNAQISNTATAKRIDNKTVAYTYDTKTSIEYSLTYTGFKEDIVVEEYTGQTEYEFTLYTNGLKLVEVDGSFCLVDGNNKVKATLGDIIIFTADERNNTMGDMLSQTVIENERYLIKIVVDPEFLSDEKTVYPIRIDPTIEISYDNNGSSAISDVTINSLQGSSGTSSALMVGYRETYGVSRILMKFPGLNLNPIGNDLVITDATVSIRDILCESTAMEVGCYVFSGNEWDESTVSWANVDANSIFKFLSSRTVSYSNGAQLSSPHWYTFNIKEAVKGWYNGTYNANKGIIFKATASVESGSTYIHKTFASFNRSSNKPFLSVTYTRPSETPITEDVYCINNKGTGDYVKYAATSVNVMSGELSDLGNSVRWEIVVVDSDYAIRLKTNNTIYLCVSETPTDNSIYLTVVTDSTIPPTCIWNINLAAGTGCNIVSVYNNRYLCTNGTSLYLQENSSDDSAVWRLITYSNLTSRELKAGTVFKDLTMPHNSSSIFWIVCDPTDAVWSEPSDFIYTDFDGNILSINESTGVMGGVSQGSTKVKLTHKVTNLEFEFNITVIALTTYKGTLSCWSNVNNNEVGYWDHDIKIYVKNYDEDTVDLNEMVEYAISEWSDVLGVKITVTSSNEDADIEVYGGTVENLQDHLQDQHKTMSGIDGITYTWDNGYSGFYYYNGIVMVERDIKSARVCIKYYSGQTEAKYKSAVLHELGHAFGYLKHSGSLNDVMYDKNTGNINLTNADKNHLSQLY